MTALLAARPEAAAAEHAQELLLEAVVEEAIEDRVDARVAVAEQVEEGHHYARRVGVRVEEQVDLAGEEGEPGHSEEHDDGGQHAHDALRLAVPALALAGQVWRLPDRPPGPQGVRDHPVRAEHRGNGQQVDEDVESEGVGDAETVVRKVLDTHLKRAH